MGLGYVVPTNLSSWTNNTIGTIPDGYIPAYYPFAGVTSRNGSWYIVSSSPNGGISIQPMVSQYQVIMRRLLFIWHGYVKIKNISHEHSYTLGDKH